MKPHKTFFPYYYLIALISIITLFSISSCAKDDTPDNPVTDEAQKFLGTWHVSDNAARLNYDVIIERNSLNYNTGIIINNFADLNGTIKGNIINNTVVIDKQETGNDGYVVEGSGSYKNSTRLEFTYTLDDNIETEMRNAVFTK